MKITSEFTVHTPIDRAWEVLTDLPGIAPCLPGAQLTGVDGDVYQGKVKVKVGPVISDFAGTARFTEKDDAAYRAVIDAKGRDARAGGNASALVTAVLAPAGEATLVTVDTDLRISGKLAQFGSGMIKEISNKLLAQFVTNLEAKLATETAEAPAAEAPAAEAPAAEAPAAEAPATETPAAADAGEPVAAATTPSAAAVETVPATAAVVAPGPPAAKPDAESPSPASLTADLVPADPGAAEPATPAVAGSEPLAASTTTEPAGATLPPATTTPPAATTTPPAPATVASRSAAPAATATDEEPEALDLLAVAGGSIYKRLVPVAVGVVVIVGVIVWLVARG